MSRGCCVPSPNILQCIYDKLKDLYTSFVFAFITSPVVYSRLVGWNVSRVVNSKHSKLSWYALFNNTGAPKYVKFYNKTDDTFDPLTTAPALRLEVPAVSGANLSGLNMDFSDGIVIRVTDGPEDTNVSHPADNTVIVNLGYKSIG